MGPYNPCEEQAITAAEGAVDLAKEAIKAAESGDLERCMGLGDEVEHLLGVAKKEADGADTERARSAVAAADEAAQMASDAYRALYSARAPGYLMHNRRRR